jgi:hypothetical protein
LDLPSFKHGSWFLVFAAWLLKIQEARAQRGVTLGTVVPNKKPFDLHQTAFMAFFMYAFLREAKNCKTFIIGAQEGTRTPTMLLAST